MLRFTPPLAGRLETAELLQSFVAGSESNTVCGMARLGLKVSWISALPDNPNGRRVAAELRAQGVDLGAVVWKQNARLGTFYAEEAPAPLGPQVTYDRAGSAFATAVPDEYCVDQIPRSRLLHLTGITPPLGNGPRTLFEQALDIAEQNGIHVSFDINYRSRLWSPKAAATGVERACRQAHVLICAKGDAAALWELTGSPEQVLLGLQERFGKADVPKTIALTCGADGSAMLDATGYSEAPAFPTDGRHRFGSGDSFGAGFLAAWLQSPHYIDAAASYGASPLAYANAMAALKRCVPGDIPRVTPDEIARVLDTAGKAGFR